MVTGPQSIGTSSPVSVVQPAGSLGTGFGLRSQVHHIELQDHRVHQLLVHQLLVHRLLGFLPLVVHQMRTDLCGSSLREEEA